MSWTQYGHVLSALLARSFNARYRRSQLGLLWAVLQPLFYIALFTMLKTILGFGTGNDAGGIPYPLLVFAGIVPWTFFSGAVNGAMQSIYSNAGILKKVALPREIFPLTSVLLAAVDSLIALVILVVTLWTFGHPPALVLLPWIPVYLVITGILAYAVGLLLAALATFRQDVAMALPFVLQFWLFANPIMYTVDQVPESLREIYRLNPFVGIITGFRSVLLEGLTPDLGPTLLALLVSLVALLLARSIFRYFAQYFVDVI